MGRLFGTDGVRGKAGEFPLDATTVRRLGAALARALRHGDKPARFLAGRDTRESGGWIEQELAFGISTQGGVLTSAGVIPTPAVAYLTPRMGYTAGVVISASHILLVRLDFLDARTLEELPLLLVLATAMVLLTRGFVRRAR